MCIYVKDTHVYLAVIKHKKHVDL